MNSNFSLRAFQEAIRWSYGNFSSNTHAIPIFRKLGLGAHPVGKGGQIVELKPNANFQKPTYDYWAGLWAEELIIFPDIRNKKIGNSNGNKKMYISQTPNLSLSCKMGLIFTFPSFFASLCPPSLFSLKQKCTKCCLCHQ